MILTEMISLLREGTAPVPINPFPDEITKYGEYLVYASGEFEGEVKTWSGALRMCKSLAKNGFTPSVKQHVQLGEKHANLDIPLPDIPVTPRKSTVSRSQLTPAMTWTVSEKGKGRRSKKAEVPIQKVISPARSTRSAPTASGIKAAMSKSDDSTITVVAAWTDDTQEIAPGQKMWRHDMGERPKFVDVKKPHSVIWANNGVEADITRAQAWVSKSYPDTGRVFVYPVTEKDPLGRARHEILK
jgi:hypothetical protein